MGLAQVNDPMLRDNELLRDFDKKSLTKPILFFYKWQKICLSIGKIQREKKQIIEEARSKNLDYYLRPTGGKAVLHGFDICYSFIATQSDPQYGGNLKESFCKVNSFICNLIKEYFMLDQLRQHNCQDLNKESSSANCFASKVIGEGVINTEKIIGAAQAFYGKSFIQQGSIQVNKNNTSWDLFKNTRSIEDYLGKSFDLDQIIEDLNNKSIEFGFQTIIK